MFHVKHSLFSILLLARTSTHALHVSAYIRRETLGDIHPDGICRSLESIAAQPLSMQTCFRSQNLLIREPELPGSRMLRRKEKL